MMKSNKRSERRRRSVNKYKSRLRLISSAWLSLPDDMTFLKNTPKLCGKQCCKNPRRTHWKSITRQEEKAEFDFKEQMKEAS